MLEVIPSNFSLTASEGGKFDSLIAKHNLKSTRVVFSTEEASVLGLDIDEDDTHAAVGKSSFGLLIHGVQAKGSKASAAVQALKN